MWSLYLRMLGRGLQQKTTAPLVLFLWLRNSEKIADNWLDDHIVKCDLFLISVWFLVFSFSVRSSESLSDRIIWAFNGSGGTRAVARDISKAFDSVWHTGYGDLRVEVSETQWLTLVSESAPSTVTQIAAK